MENLKEKIMQGLTIKHNGKMEGMLSFSTSTTHNEFCQKIRQIKGTICEKCFANRMCKMYGDKFIEKYYRNEWIKTTEIKKEDVPFLNVAYFRFEAFGELETLQQLKNYCTIAKYNKHCNFAVWTKRLDIIKQFNLKDKPKNLNIIISSYKINKPMALTEDIKEKVDGLFTVYDKNTTEKITINCGGA